MISLNLFQVSTLLTAAVSLFLGMFIFFGGKKTKLNLSWLLNSLAISLWSLGLFGVVISTSEKAAWFWQYVLDIGGICIPLAYLYFLLCLIKREKEMIWLRLISCLVAIGLIILNFTSLFKTGVSSKFGINYWITPGSLYFLFPLYFFLSVAACFYLVVREYKISVDQNQKRQLLYILMAQVIGFGGGFTDFFPQLFNVYPFGSYFIILYVIFISYAALKHHLFDTRVIATEVLTSAICVALMSKVALSNSAQDLVINVIIFILVALFSLLLVRSVINEVKQKEQIEQMAKELKKAYEVEKIANEELEKLDKYKDNFLMQAQHDLKNPLAIIMGYTDLLLSGNFGKISKKGSDIIKRMQVVTQEKIRDVNNFLDVQQFKAGKSVVRLKPGVDVFPVLKEICSSLEYQAKSKGIYLNLENFQEECLVSADREKLKSALANIINNAVKYTQKGGVDVSLEKEGNKVKIKVSDTGIGIPKDKVKNVFETQFERTKGAEKTASGSGVGLYLSAKIIELHNGKVFAESDGEGKGSVFIVEIPA